MSRGSVGIEEVNLAVCKWNKEGAGRVMERTVVGEDGKKEPGQW
jgi:hypothetical protein